jgi:hypothetical protein
LIDGVIERPPSAIGDFTVRRLMTDKRPSQQLFTPFQRGDDKVCSVDYEAVSARSARHTSQDYGGRGGGFVYFDGRGGI